MTKIAVSYVYLLIKVYSSFCTFHSCLPRLRYVANDSQRLFRLGNYSHGKITTNKFKEFSSDYKASNMNGTAKKFGFLKLSLLAHVIIPDGRRNHHILSAQFQG